MCKGNGAFTFVFAADGSKRTRQFRFSERWDLPLTNVHNVGSVLGDAWSVAKVLFVAQGIIAACILLVTSLLPGHCQLPIPSGMNLLFVQRACPLA